MNNIYTSSPVVMLEPQESYDLVVYIYTPPALRERGLMRKLWEDEIIPDVHRNLFLVFNPDPGVDDARLRKFYESVGFEFDTGGTFAVRVHEA